MQERIFTLKKGTEVPAQFDGVTVPFQVPSSVEEMIRVCGGNEQTVVAVFNQAHALNVQKAVKADAQDEGQTVDGLRKIAAEFKYGQVRQRTGTGAPKQPKPQQLDSALGEDFLAMLTPEQRALYEQKKAALASNGAKKETAAATEAAPTETKAPAASAKKR